MHKTGLFIALLRLEVVSHPVCPSHIQQVESAYDIGFNEYKRVSDRVAHMTFSCKVDHLFDVILGEHGLDGWLVPDVHLFESVVSTLLDQRVDVVQVGCVGHAVHVHDVV